MEQNSILTFYDEDNREVELEIVDSFELSGKQYAALATPETDDEESEVFIMRIETISEDEDAFAMIEDDAELDAAFEMFKDRCGEEFDIID